jgi:uncharacterized membrane protein YbhN (UPF0104 family)
MLKRQLVVLFVKYGLGLGLLAWVICSYWHIPSPEGEVGLAGVFERPIHVVYLTLAGALALGSMLLTFVRWYFLVRAQSLPFTLAGALRLGMIGFYLSTFLPGAVGGDIIKAAFIAREQSRRTVAVATVIVDRAIGLCGLIWLVALIGGYFWVTGLLPHIATGAIGARADAVTVLETIFLGAAGLMLGSLGFWLLLGLLSQERADRLAAWLRGIPKIGGPLGELWRAGWLYRCSGRSVGLALLLSIVGHVGFVLAFFFSARTLNEAQAIPSARAHVLVVPVGMTVSAGIPTPGGVGGGEFVYGKLYEILGYSFAAGVLGSLMQRCTNWVLGLTGYLIYLRMKPGLVKTATPGKVAEQDPAAPAASGATA